MQGFRLGAGIATALLIGGIAAAQTAKPTDAQIAHIAYTAGSIDITAAEHALKKSQNPEVRSFAEAYAFAFKMTSKAGAVGRGRFLNDFGAATQSDGEINRRSRLPRARVSSGRETRG